MARYAYLPSLAVNFYYGIDANQLQATAGGVFGATKSTQQNTVIQSRQNLGYAGDLTPDIPLWNWGATRSKVRQAESNVHLPNFRPDLPSTNCRPACSRFIGRLRSHGTRSRRCRSRDLASENLHLTMLRYQAGLKLGDPGQIHIPGLKKNVPGKIAVISPALDPNSTTVEVRVEALNPDNDLQPGTSVQVALVAKVVPDALVVPLASILTEANGAKSVMVVGAGSHAHRQTVTTGIEHNGSVQIVSGVRPGEEIIASGAYGNPDNTLVRSSSASSAAGTGPAMIRQPEAEPNQSTMPEEGSSEQTFWLVRYSKALIGLVLALVVYGIYVALQIPTSVFPTTNFTRVIIALDNGVTPINQMLVSVTRPVEIAVSSVRGLQSVRSITSRGTAEIDLFFDCNANMFETLQRVDSALATIQGSLPPTVKVDAHRLTFSSFPILGLVSRRTPCR